MHTHTHTHTHTRMTNSPSSTINTVAMLWSFMSRTNGSLEVSTTVKDLLPVNILSSVVLIEVALSITMLENVMTREKGERPDHERAINGSTKELEPDYNIHTH